MNEPDMIIEGGLHTSLSPELVDWVSYSYAIEKYELSIILSVPFQKISIEFMNRSTQSTIFEKSG
jgi:hypothetical protein